MILKSLCNEEEISVILPFLVELQLQHIESLPGLFKDYINADKLLKDLKDNNPALLQHIAQGKEMFFAFESKGVPIGCATAKTQDIGNFDFEDSHHLFVTSFYLSPEHRGRGRGSRAFALLLEWAESNDFRKIVLSVDSTNKYAINFYKKFGLRSEMMYMSRLLKAALSDSKFADGNSTNSKSAEGKSADGSSTNSTPADGKSADGSSTDSNSTDRIAGGEC